MKPNCLFVIDWMSMSVLDTLLSIIIKKTRMLVYLYICGECGAHRSLSIDRLKVLDSRHRLPYETELFVRDRLDVYERVGHTIVDYYQKDKNARIYLYICGECGAHRSLSIDRLKVLDSRECTQCTQRLGENNVFMSLSKMKEMLVALPVDVRFIDNYTELDFNAAIDQCSGRVWS